MNHLIYIWLLVSLFPLSLRILGENRAKLTKQQTYVRSTIPRYTLIIFLLPIAVTQVIFWTENNFYFIFDCRNSFNCKLKKLINEQTIIFYSPSSVLCSSDKSVQVIPFKHHALIGMISLFTWFNLPILNFC